MTAVSSFMQLLCVCVCVCVCVRALNFRRFISSEMRTRCVSVTIEPCWYYLSQRRNGTHLFLSMSPFLLGVSFVVSCFCCFVICEYFMLCLSFSPCTYFISMQFLFQSIYFPLRSNHFSAALIKALIIYSLWQHHYAASFILVVASSRLEPTLTSASFTSSTTHVSSRNSPSTCGR